MTTLDPYARDDLRSGLKAWADLTDRYGFDHAQRALEEAVHSQHIAYADILVRGTRMAYWTPTEASTVDLTTYDRLIPEVLHD